MKIDDINCHQCQTRNLFILVYYFCCFFFECFEKIMMTHSTLPHNPNLLSKKYSGHKHWKFSLVFSPWALYIFSGLLLLIRNFTSRFLSLLIFLLLLFSIRSSLFCFVFSFLIAYDKWNSNDIIWIAKTTTSSSSLMILATMIEILFIVVFGRRHKSDFFFLVYACFCLNKSCGFIFGLSNEMKWDCHQFS